MSAAAAEDAALADWGVPERTRGLWLNPAGVVIPTFVSLLVALVVGLMTGGLVVAALTLVALLFVGVGWWLSQPRLALRSARATPLRAGTEPRLENLVEGLASDVALAAPSLWLLPGEPNALVCRRGASGALAVSKILVERYTRTELEAVIAHCMVRLSDRHGMLDAALTAAIGGHGRAAARVGFADDRRAVALTRYPPALATAIEKASPHSGRTSPFWFVARHRSHRAPEARVAELRTL